MKNIISILALASLLMTSCNEDFIEVIPESIATTDLLFKSDKDFQDAVIGSYSELKDFYNYYWQFGDLRGDDAVQYAARLPERVRIDEFALDVNDNILNNAWRDLYQVIQRANTLLSKIEIVDESIIPNKDLYIGEAKFIRALAYFNLVRIFGDVPMITTPISIDEAYDIGREKTDIIYDEIIIKDLLAAENNLPEQYSATDVGRATKGAAKALMGKVYLTRKDFMNAEAKLREVTTMGYALLDNFEDLFDFDNEHHSEYIFDIEYIDGNIGLGSSFTSLTLVEVQDVGAFHDVLNAAYNIPLNIAGAGGGSPNLEFIAAFDSLDLRKEETVATGVFDITGNWVPIPAGSAVPAITTKYLTSIVNGGDGKANWKVIRYADVLLMLAEALNENGKTPEALTYLNQIRIRAGLPAFSDLTQAEARNKIYWERRFELYMEGHRWFDLVRTDRAFEVMEPYGMEPHHTVFPIPQSQIEVINDPSIFSQNPGY